MITMGGPRGNSEEVQKVICSLQHGAYRHALTPAPSGWSWSTSSMTKDICTATARLGAVTVRMKMQTVTGAPYWTLEQVLRAVAKQAEALAAAGASRLKPESLDDRITPRLQLAVALHRWRT